MDAQDAVTAPAVVQQDAQNAARAPPAAARRAAKAMAKAGKGIWGGIGAGAAAFGHMFKVEKPAPTQALELQEVPAHRTSGSVSSSVVSSEMDQQI